jgi:hypothetical protein
MLCTGYDLEKFFFRIMKNASISTSMKVHGAEHGLTLYWGRLRVGF